MYWKTNLVYGPWIAGQNPVDKPWNISIWPYGIPIGLAVLTASIKKREGNLAIVASPFLSPYLAKASLGLPILGLLPSQSVTIAAILGLWLVRILSGAPLAF